MSQTTLILRLMKVVVLFILLAGSCQKAISESGGKMQFHGSQPGSIFGSIWMIYADGEIDMDAGERLSRYVNDNKIPAHSLVVLNSPGGNLLGGMKLGRAIRAAGLSSTIGKLSNAATLVSGPGECYSACTLAYIGGEYRFNKHGSVYGVHRFYSSIHNAEDSDIAQIISASVVQYIREMGVDTELFSLMTQAGAKEIRIVRESDMARMNIVNDGLKPTQWTIETTKEGMYIKGQRETYYGINKIMLECAPNAPIILGVIFDPQGRGDAVVKSFKKESLVIDEYAIPIDPLQLTPPALYNGWVNASYLLSNELVQRLTKAHTVGVMFQTDYKEPVFLGFRDMDFSEGAKKLPGFINFCGKN